ncbi:MAG: hypothetical protein LBQ79_08815 [Deltaproteobacteria bacterium]|jgi:hypothetical protein|nr:hypothetical protein [Deltaproteobacteria bacterium]
MNVNNSANSLPGLLVTTLLDGQKKQTDLAMKTIQVAAEQTLAVQQQQTAILAVALLTGIGTKLDTFV